MTRGGAKVDRAAQQAVELIEVGPRDGLQNEPSPVTTDTKLALIQRLLAAGLRRIEVTSFAHPKKVPQMADAERLCDLLPQRDDVRYAGLVLNGRGYERARATGRLHDVLVVVPVTDSFGRRNQGQSAAECVALAREVAVQAQRDGMRCQVALTVAFGCPFEGEVAAGHVADVAAQVAVSGVDEIVLSDTIGCAVPSQVAEVIAATRGRIGDAVSLRGHFHNTRNTAVANIYAALQSGVMRFDASLGGLGGCPFAPAATGNVATEDVLYLCDRMGLRSGVDLQQLIAASAWLGTVLGHPLPGMVARAGAFPVP
jgi:hydroxymethylglutaryl-CoA lyase